MVEVIVPFRGGCPHRERAWRWVRNRCVEQHPGWSVVVAEAAPGAWVKATAVTPAVCRSTADVIVVLDADVWCEGIAQAVDAVQNGAPWATPQNGVFRLTEQSTAAVLAGAAWESLETVEPPWAAFAGGGIVVARRETLADVPLDPRFVGWGHEDEAWARALDVLGGKRWRGGWPLVHLWHPPQPRRERGLGSQANMRLLRRYTAARRKPEQMRALLDEVTNADPRPDYEALHRHAGSAGRL